MCVGDRMVCKYYFHVEVLKTKDASTLYQKQDIHLHMIEMQRTALTLFDHDPGYAGNNHWADPTGVSSHCKVCKPPGIC